MTDRVVAALIIGASLVVAGYLSGGRYQGFGGSSLCRGSTYGAAWFCGVNARCAPMDYSN